MLIQRSTFPGETVGDISSRLNPEFWSGHTLGQGDAEPAPTIPFPSPGVTDALATPGTLKVPSALRLPLRQFGTGHYFDANDHPSGTFLLYHKETLEGEPLSEAEIEEHSALPLPASGVPIPKPGPTPTAKLPFEYYTYLEEGDRKYLSMIYGGVVQEISRLNRRKVLLGFPLFGGFRSEPKDATDSSGRLSSMIFYTGPPQVEPNPLDIGMPSHFRHGNSGPETIQRINMMELYIAGDDEGVKLDAIRHSTGATAA